MSRETTTPQDAPQDEVKPSGEDTRREWVTPTIAELPLASTQGTITPTGTDAAIYS